MKQTNSIRLFYSTVQGRRNATLPNYLKPKINKIFRKTALQTIFILFFMPHVLSDSIFFNDKTT